MKLTNLEYVQTTLSAMSSDQVNSVSDTAESLQVLAILKTCYFNIVARAHLPEQTKLFQLDSSQNVLEPTLMFIPQGVKEMKWLKYFNADPNAMVQAYAYVNLIGIQQFLDFVNGYNPDDSFVDTMNLETLNGESFIFRYRNDVQPTFATVLSDYYVIFDAYNNTLEDTLQSSKSQSYGVISPVWSDADDFIPELDDGQVPLLLNEVKSLAFFELKQVPHQKAEQEAKRQWSSLQRDKSIDNKPSYFDQLPDFGRTKAFSHRPYFKWH